MKMNESLKWQLETYINSIVHTAHYSLFQACYHHDMTLAEKLLQKGADPNFLVKGINSLYLATIFKDKKMLKLLLKSRGNPNIFYENQTVSEKGLYQEDTQFFLNHHLHENGQTNYYQSLIGLCCKMEEPKLLKALFKNGVDLNYYLYKSKPNSDFALFYAPARWIKMFSVTHSEKYLKLLKIFLKQNFEFSTWQDYFWQQNQSFQDTRFSPVAGEDVLLKNNKQKQLDNNLQWQKLYLNNLIESQKDLIQYLHIQAQKNQVYKEIECVGNPIKTIKRIKIL